MNNALCQSMTDKTCRHQDKACHQDRLVADAIAQIADSAGSQCGCSTADGKQHPGCRSYVRTTGFAQRFDKKRQDGHDKMNGAVEKKNNASMAGNPLDLKSEPKPPVFCSTVS
jgi:hypothetical protein